MANSWVNGPDISVDRYAPAGFGSITSGIMACGASTFAGTAFDSTEEFDGTAWSTGATVNAARYFLSSAGTTSAGLLAGGSATGGPTETTTCQEFNGTTWSTGGALSAARVSNGGCGTQTAGLAFGGNPGAELNTSEEYNGTSWSAGGTLSGNRSFTAGAGTQTSGLAVAGFQAVDLDTSEEYNGTSWSAGGTLNNATRVHCSTGSSITAGLAFGGTSATTTESYNGTAWTSEAALNTGGVAGGCIGDESSTLVAFFGKAFTEKWGAHVSIAPASLTGTFSTPAPIIPIIVFPATVVGAFSILSPAVSGVIVITPDPVTGIFTIPSPAVMEVIVTPAALVASFTVPTPTVGLPTIVTVNAVTGTFSILAPDVVEQAIVVGVSNFPQGVATEYQVVDKDLNILQAWTNTGVQETSGPSKSAYFVSTNIITSDFQGVIYWRTPDLTYEASETIDAFQANIKTLLDRLTEDRADNLDNLDVAVSTRLADADYSILGIKKNTALANFPFQMIDSTDGKTSKTGLTITSERSIDGGAFAATANSATELSDGAYLIDLAASDLNGDTIMLKFTAAGGIDRQIAIFTQT